MIGVISSKFGLMVPHGKLESCIAELEEGLRAAQKTPYHDILGQNFLHHTDAVAEYLIEFHRLSADRIHLAAIYLEMNGFSVNTDRWYLDGFGYQQAGDIWDLDWLASWDAETQQNFTLTGMESVQIAFEDLYGQQDLRLSVEIAGELAEHLVTARFMQLVASAHEVAKKKYNPLNGIPVLATAHDWDTVHETK